MLHRASVAVVVACVVATVGLPASAHSIRHHDPTEGAEADIYASRVRIEDTGSGKVLKAIVVFEGVQFLDDLTVWLDTTGDDSADAYATTQSEGDNGIFEAYLWRDGSPTSIGFARTSPELGWKITFLVPLELLQKDKHVRYYVAEVGRNSYSGENSSDMAPDAGWYEH